MKELSIKEKAEAYDGNYKAYTELINRIEDVKEAIKKQNYGIAMDILCKPYPQFQVITHSELKESEDERIRKTIICGMYALKDQHKTYFASIPIDNVIAWLENQGEQKPTDKVEPKFKVGQTIKKEGFNLGFSIVKIEDGFYYNDMGDYFPFTDQDNWELVEQKTAWSEEDEDILNTIINHFKVDIECTDEDDIVRWLKSLKDRVQPKQERSEEDEKMLNDIIKDLVHPWNEYIPDRIEDEIKWLKNRLKSLRPQDTWKPSDEQMKALCKFIDTGNTNATVLESLYKDLKKLREE